MIFNMMSGRMKTPVLDAAYPANTTVTAGASATFQAVISHDGMPAAYTYQWYVNGAAVAGATGPSYTRDTAQDKGQYAVFCQVTSPAGTVTTPTATLSVNALPVLSSAYPANAATVFNASVTCEVRIATAGYPEAYRYQWYKNGAAVSGATGASYTFTPNAVGTATLYCKVTNAAGTVTSRTATITATPLYLYNAGSENTDLTGGWKVYYRRPSTSVLYSVTTRTPTLTKAASAMTFQVTSLVTNYECGCIGATAALDLTGYNTLTFSVTGLSLPTGSSDAGKLCLYVTSDTSNEVFSVAAYKLCTAAGTYSIDVSALSGNYQVGAALVTANAVPNAPSATIASVQLK